MTKEEKAYKDAQDEIAASLISKKENESSSSLSNRQRTMERELDDFMEDQRRDAGLKEEEFDRQKKIDEFVEIQQKNVWATEGYVASKIDQLLNSGKLLPESDANGEIMVLKNNGTDVYWGVMDG